MTRRATRLHLSRLRGRSTRRSRVGRGPLHEPDSRSGPLPNPPPQAGEGANTRLRRRDVLTLLDGTMAALSRPLTAPAQQDGRMRRMGVLTTSPENDAEILARLAAFRQRLGVLGWVEGRTLQTTIRWGNADPERASRRRSS
jgi:hypothetical protein